MMTMNHFEADSHNSAADRAEFFSLSRHTCLRCEAKSSDGYYLSEVITFEGTREILCDDCAAADRKLDLEADALVALSSCPVREEIIDATTSIKAMVEALKAHDLTQCAACAATRRPMVKDRPHMDLESVCHEGRAT
jgi:hypothetical protein